MVFFKLTDIVIVMINFFVDANRSGVTALKKGKKIGLIVISVQIKWINPYPGADKRYPYVYFIHCRKMFPAFSLWFVGPQPFNSEYN